jgi:hypothetical protein
MSKNDLPKIEISLSDDDLIALLNNFEDSYVERKTSGDSILCDVTTKGFTKLNGLCPETG